MNIIDIILTAISKPAVPDKPRRLDWMLIWDCAIAFLMFVGLGAFLFMIWGDGR